MDPVKYAYTMVGAVSDKSDHNVKRFKCENKHGGTMLSEAALAEIPERRSGFIQLNRTPGR